MHKRRKINHTLLLVLLAGCGICFSCVSVRILANLDVDNACRAGDFEIAISLLDKSHKAYYTSKENVLVKLEDGLLYHYSCNYSESNKFLAEAEKLIEKNYTKNIAQEIGTAFVNDNVRNYAGEFYEDIYTNVFMCLNYIHLGQFDDAMVEIRRFDNKMKFSGKQYQTVIDSSKKSLEANSDYKKGTVPDGNVEFHNSALARYLSMLLYYYDGQKDAAAIDKTKIHEAFKNQPKVYRFKCPRCVDSSLEVLNKNARLDFVAFTGLCPVKSEVSTRVPTNSFYYKLALPQMQDRKSIVDSVLVMAVNQGTGKLYQINLEPLENIGSVAKDTFNHHYSAIFGKTMARSIAKTIPGAVMKEVSKKSDNFAVSFFLTFASAISDIATEVTEQADIRCCRYFPCLASAGSVNVPEGIYDLNVIYLNANGNTIRTNRIQGREVKADRLNLFEDINLN